MITIIKLKNKVKDEITGLVGTTTAKVEYISGQIAFCVQPSVDKDGKLPSEEWINEERLYISE